MIGELTFLFSLLMISKKALESQENIVERDSIVGATLETSVASLNEWEEEIS